MTRLVLYTFELCYFERTDYMACTCMCDGSCRGPRSSSLIVKVLFLEMEPPAKRRIHRPCFQDSWKTGRVPGSDPVEMVAPGTHVPGCPTILEQTLVPMSTNNSSLICAPVYVISSAYRSRPFHCLKVTINSSKLWPSSKCPVSDNSIQ